MSTRSMDTLRKKGVIVLCCVFSVTLTACQKEFVNRPTPIPTRTPSNTFTPTITLTPTLVPTVTLTPSQTPTHTLTPYPSSTPTAISTNIPPQPVSLFDLRDNADRLVDWRYAYVSEVGSRDNGEVNQLSAMLAFQLMDRGIHSFNLRFDARDITVYYLNVRHDFNGTLTTMRLVIGGTYGKDVPISLIPADGSAYIEFRKLDSKAVFNPGRNHQESLLPFAERQALVSTMLLQDFESMLPELPDTLIVLAEHPILWPKDDWVQVKLDMTRVSAYAARFYPFFSLDAYDLLVGPSELALALAEHLLDGSPMPLGTHDFASQTLIFITP